MRLHVRRFATPVGAAVLLVGIAGSAVGLGCSRGDSAGAAAAASASAGLPDAAPSSTVVVASPIPSAVVAATLNPTKLPAYDGPTGSIEGTIFVIGPASPDVHVDTTHCPAAVDTYGKLFREGTPVVPGGPRPLADAVVIAVGYGGYYVPERHESKLVTISKACAYPTRAISLTYGQRLEIANESKFAFVPRLDGDISPAVMMAPPMLSGDPIHLYPRMPGHGVLTDLMQPFVKEDIYVFRHPLHTVSGLDGHYRIDGVPVGKLAVKVQAFTVGSEAQAPVEIEAKVVKTVDLTVEYAPGNAQPALPNPNNQVVR